MAHSHLIRIEVNMMKDKIKNPIFWLGLISIIFGAAGVDFNTLTSWQLFGEALFSIVQNPVAIVAVIGAIIAVWNDNSLPGLDKINRKMTIELKDPQERVKNIPGVCYIKSNGKYKAYICSTSDGVGRAEGDRF